MAVVLILISALAASLVGVFSKLGANDKVDSVLNTSLKVAVMLIISFFCMLVSDGLNFTGLDGKMWLLILASGIAISIAWICFFKAVDMGETLRVVAIDKFSVVFIVFYSLLFFNESFSWFTAAGILLVFAGIVTITVRAFRKPKGVLPQTAEALPQIPDLSVAEPKHKKRKSLYIILAFISAFTVSLMTLFSKLGLEEMDTNTATFLRTAIGLAILISIVFFTRRHGDVRLLNGKQWRMILLSGTMNAIGWLTFYPAIMLGNAAVIASLDKVSIVFAMIWSMFILKEKPDRLTVLACIFIVAGAIVLVL